MDELIEELNAMDWGEHPAVGKAATALRAYAEREKRLTSLVHAMLDNEPDDLAADGGITVLMVWRHEARAILSKHKEQK
jgi:hypothetical protein